MRLQTRGLFGVVAILAIAGFVVAGCGGDEDTTATEPATETGAAGGAGGGVKGATLEIKMGEFYFNPKNATAKAGPTTIEAPNEGSVEHELVVFKTNMNPAKLPTEANGEVNEEKMDKVAEGAGEIPDVEAGDTKSGDFKLTPGKYVMFCNLPGHYTAGMYGTLTVTE
ncbi:MAG: hypothetical protein JJE35_01160 [Thermoleophilia bacterium]|nr:hypothetical protein [Thermoleophilia bacterium]